MGEQLRQEEGDERQEAEWDPSGDILELAPPVVLPPIGGISRSLEGPTLVRVRPAPPGSALSGSEAAAAEGRRDRPLEEVLLGILPGILRGLGLTAEVPSTPPLPDNTARGEGRAGSSFSPKKGKKGSKKRRGASDGGTQTLGVGAAPVAPSVGGGGGPGALGSVKSKKKKTAELALAAG